jgi:hypothetical protein
MIVRMVLEYKLYLKNIATKAIFMKGKGMAKAQ